MAAPSPINLTHKHPSPSPHQLCHATTQDMPPTTCATRERKAPASHVFVQLQGCAVDQPFETVAHNTTNYTQQAPLQQRVTRWQLRHMPYNVPLALQRGARMLSMLESAAATSTPAELQHKVTAELLQHKRLPLHRPSKPCPLTPPP
jgi:hypothetical protein